MNLLQHPFYQLLKWSSVKVEEVKDVKDEEVEMHSPSPSLPEAGPL